MPSSQSVEATHNATLITMVTGVGSNNFTYQWRHNGTIISGETRDTLIIRNVTTYDTGVYSCTVMNQYGDSNSSLALFVVTGTHGQLLFSCYRYLTRIASYIASLHIYNYT